MSKDQYFATLSIEDIGSALSDKIQKYYNFLRQTKRWAIMKAAYDMYYKSEAIAGSLYLSGNNKEYVNIVINHFRNIVQHMLTLTTSQKPAFDAIARNNDTKTEAQTVLANGLLEYYMAEKELEPKFHDATELSLVCGEGFLSTTWDVTKGSEITKDLESNLPIKEGDVSYQVYSTLDVIRDYTKLNAADHQWYITRTFVNRFDLIAQFPEHADAIANLSQNHNFGYDMRFHFFVDDDTDDIAVFNFYHSKTPAVPDGRFVVFLADDLVLMEGPFPYSDDLGLPVYRVAPSIKQQSPFGFTSAWDLLPIQEAITLLDSIILSNQNAFGTQCIATPHGSNLQYTALTKGLALIEFDPKSGPPVPLNLVKTPPEIFNQRANYVRDAEVVSAVNSVVRGDPAASLRSGNALALIQSNAIQFSSALQKSYHRFLSQVGTATIQLLKQFAKHPRMAMIVGKSQKGYLKYFNSDDLSDIVRVTIDVGNPLSKTISGRMNIAEMMIQQGAVETPEQLIQVLSTGRLDPIINDRRDELMLIQEENEMLLEGKPVRAMITDNPVLHLKGHKSVTANPVLRNSGDPKDQAVLAAALIHEQEHLELWTNANPTLQNFYAIMNASPPIPTAPQLPPGSVGQTMDSTNPVMNAAANSLPSPPESPNLEGEL